MAFRDDREALKQRAADLESELDAAEKELLQQREHGERNKLLQEELVRTRERLHAMERKLPGRRNSSPFVLVGLAIGFSKCEIADGKPTLFRDVVMDADGTLDWSVGESTVRVGGRSEADWSVEIRLAP